MERQQIKRLFLVYAFGLHPPKSFRLMKGDSKEASTSVEWPKRFHLMFINLAAQDDVTAILGCGLLLLLAANHYVLHVLQQCLHFWKNKGEFNDNDDDYRRWRNETKHPGM